METIPTHVLVELAFDLSTTWKKLGRVLGISNNQITGISKDFSQDVMEQGYRMLVAWKQKEGSMATYQALEKGLLSRYVQRTDLAESYCQQKKGYLVRKEIHIEFLKSGVVSKADLQGIADDLGNKWLWVGRLLALDDSLLDQIKEENPRNMSECSYQMLDAWTKKDGSNATYNCLAQMLLHRVVQLRSIAEVYCAEESQQNRADDCSSPLEEKMENLNLAHRSETNSVSQDGEDQRQNVKNNDKDFPSPRFIPSDCVKRKCVTTLPYNVWKELEIKLKPWMKSASGGDFRDLASKFGYNIEKILYLESLESPTKTLLADILPSVEELCARLELIGRPDACILIYNWVGAQGCKCTVCNAS